MSIFEPSPLATRMLAILRIVAGLVFISAGTMNLFNYPPSPTPGAPVPLMSELGIGAVLQIVGGLAVVAGLLTRPVSFVLAGEMAVAYLQFHLPLSFFPTVSGGMPALLYCFLFLYLAFAGAGAWSIDATIARARRNE